MRWNAMLKSIAAAERRVHIVFAQHLAADLQPCLNNASVSAVMGSLMSFPSLMMIGEHFMPELPTYKVFALRYGTMAPHAP